MSSLLNHISEPIIPNSNEKEIARQSSIQLARLLNTNTTAQVLVQLNEQEEAVCLPASVARLLVNILAEMGKGNAVMLEASTPMDAELTTQQAADLLHVSRPFLIDQLEKGAISYRKVGTHRRILFKDVMEYKHTMDRKRLESLEELSALDQELGLGD